MKPCLSRIWACYWVVWSRSHGTIRSFASKKAAKDWQKNHGPTATRVFHVCTQGGRA